MTFDACKYVCFLYFLVSFPMCAFSVSVGIAEMQVWAEMASLFGLMQGTTIEAKIYGKIWFLGSFWYFELKEDSCFVQLCHVANVAMI
jgi:hypothetical protein